MAVEIHGKFRRAFVTRSLTEVDQNEASFQAFDKNSRMIGSQGLRGCFVVIIASRLAAIVAHVGPTSVDRVMDEVKRLYNTTKDAYFRDREVWIVRATVLNAMHLTNAALNLAGSAIEHRLAEIGLVDPKSAGYSFQTGSPGNSPEFSDKGTIIVGHNDNNVELWVENRLLRRW